MSDKPVKEKGKLLYGTQNYADWLKTLDADQMEKHLEERRQRRNDKKLKMLVNERIERDAVILADKIMDYTYSMIKNNVDNPIVFNAIMDKFIGKEVQQLDITSSDKTLPPIQIMKKDE